MREEMLFAFSGITTKIEKFFQHTILFVIATVTALAISFGSINAAANAQESSEAEDFLLTLKHENTYMSYSQEGGVTDYDGASAGFSPEYSPRLEVGIIFYQDLGVRGRYWSFNNDAESDDNDIVDVDTNYFDVELFQKVQVTQNNELEWSMGLRTMEFEQMQTGNAGVISILGDFDGFGGTVALEGKRKLCKYSKLYARCRYSILIGKHTSEIYNNGVLLGTWEAYDSNVYQTEIAFGYEFNIPLADWNTLNINIGYEWQNWSNVALGDNSFGGVGNDDVLEDASFFGWVLGVEFEF